MEMPAGGKQRKANGVLSAVFHAALEIPQRRRDSHISTAPTTVLIYVQDGAEAEALVCRGKVEIQKQDSPLSHRTDSLRRKEGGSLLRS